MPGSVVYDVERSPGRGFDDARGGREAALVAVEHEVVVVAAGETSAVRCRR